MPIRGWIFDLDGTLVGTEGLKALSYAQAAQDLRPGQVAPEQVLEAFKRVVGQSRRSVAQALLQAFHLEDQARAQMARWGVTTPWQAFLQMRLVHYQRMLADQELIREHAFAHSISLLRQVRQEGCRTALVTMSGCRQAMGILQALDLERQFDFIASVDDVERGKPDPEIYLLALDSLGLPPKACLAVEDSAAGVQAALAAGVSVIALASEFTLPSLLEMETRSGWWLVREPDELAAMIECAAQQAGHLA